MKAAETKLCECGCGEPVKSKFLPGHDQRLAAALIRTALDDSLHHMKRKAAREELERRGWSGKLAKSEASRLAKATKKPKTASEPGLQATDR
jgi:hypothetical protein